MGKFSKYLKNEVDVEIFAGCHVFMYIFLYGFYGWIDNKTAIPFKFIVEATIIGYIISWLQKILFLKKGVYKKVEYKVYSFIWIIAPVVITIISGIVFKWFSGMSEWVKIVFDITVIVYYPTFFFLLEFFYREDTKELNTMLDRYKKQKG